jgi:hypothetical protein
LSASSAGTIKETFVRRQSELGQDGFNLLIDVPTIQRIDARLRLGQALERRSFRRPCLMRGLMELRQQRAQLAQSARYDFEYSLVRIRRHLLLEVRHPQSLHTPDLALIRHGRTGDDAEQGRFAGAVSADEANSFARVDLKVDVRQ